MEVDLTATETREYGAPAVSDLGTGPADTAGHARAAGPVHETKRYVMTPRIEDPVRVVLPRTLAVALNTACTTQMDEHQWSAENVAAARRVLTGGGAEMLLGALAERLDRTRPSSPGWALLALPAMLEDEELQVAAAGVLAALGRPFFSIRQGDGRLWIGEETSSAKDQGSFGGTGRQGLHIDAPNVECVPEYTSLLVLRADPAGGGTSLLGDLRTAVAQLDEIDREALREPVFFEGQAEGLRGVGAPRMPFPVLEDREGEPIWVRWAAKMVRDQRNTGRTAVLERFTAALEKTTVAVTLGRGQLLVVDQRRIAHGRTALGHQQGLPDGTRRWIMQAKATFDPAAPAHQTLIAAGRRGNA
ncbi:TauD/TfdA family dioxygenase [Streptomyces sp. NBC_00724]|uniref:TauD/TfdA family dioxygenase n=1 Tax=Streptomyces sp. NBC_00724 TaxID=2975812 RepID=UPI002ED5CAF2|nr:TauD/TfdA family dioxygenase [Streptomyces sp. NBC_00724]